jgi:hypothetical protein
MELKENMYVRTKSGFIFKITGGNEDNWEFDYPKYILECFDAYWLELYAYNDNYSYFRDNVVKASFDIIDLIEVGDYVNGMKVIEINKIGKFVITGYGFEGTIYERQIKSIVTREQFEQM